ncbi:MAG: phosphatidate cytidylyltransferase [Burkholderiales bacterium]
MRSPEGLALRLLTAAVLLGAFFAALLLDRAWFVALVALLVGAGGFEWGRLAGLRPGAAGAYALCVGLLVAALGWTLQPGGAAVEGLLAAGAVFWLFVAPAWLWRGVGVFGGAALIVSGIAVLAWAGLAAASLSGRVLLFMLGLVWIADTAAYFAGNAFGRRKLAPSISPGKTWEGVAGAAVASLIYAIICGMPGAPLAALADGAGWGAYLGAAVLLCGVSIVGDLFESALKRRAGAKDSGGLLPGHGGILDRIDSVMSTLPIAALMVHWSTRG